MSVPGMPAFLNAEGNAQVLATPLEDTRRNQATGRVKFKTKEALYKDLGLQ